MDLIAAQFAAGEVWVAVDPLGEALFAPVPAIAGLALPGLVSPAGGASMAAASVELAAPEAVLSGFAVARAA